MLSGRSAAALGVGGGDCARAGFTHPSCCMICSLWQCSSEATCTPYWTTFELPLIDMKAALVGTVDQIVAGLRQCILRRTQGGSAKER
jgi:hypothetical protein